jgi:hypothetical protein
MMCQYREGKEKCTWWITGCLNLYVSAEIRKVYNGQIPRSTTRDIDPKFYSYYPPIQDTALGMPKNDGSRYLRGKTE